MVPPSNMYVGLDVDFSEYHLALLKGHMIRFDMTAVTLGCKQGFLGRKSRVWVLFLGEFLWPFENKGLAVCGCLVPEPRLAEAAVKR